MRTNGKNRKEPEGTGKRGFMLKNKSSGYKLLFFIFLFFVVIKLATLITAICCVVFYFKQTYTQSLISVTAIIALLADLLANLIIWGLNLKLKLLGKPASWALLLSPVLLLSVLVLNVFFADPSNPESRIEKISWVLTAGYLLIIDVFLTLGIIKKNKNL